MFFRYKSRIFLLTKIGILWGTTIQNIEHPTHKSTFKTEFPVYHRKKGVTKVFFFWQFATVDDDDDDDDENVDHWPLTGNTFN